MFDYLPSPDTDIGELVDGEYILLSENQDKVQIHDLCHLTM